MQISVSAASCADLLLNLELAHFSGSKILRRFTEIIVFDGIVAESL